MQTEMAKKSGFIRLKNRTAFHGLYGVARERRDQSRRNTGNKAMSFASGDETSRSGTAG